MADLRAHVFALPAAARGSRYFDRTSRSDGWSRASTNDVDAIVELFASGALNAIGDLVSPGRHRGHDAAARLALSLIAFAALPLVALIVRFVRARSREAFRDIRAKTARMNAIMNEQVAGMTRGAGLRARGQPRPSSTRSTSPTATPT